VCKPLSARQARVPGAADIRAPRQGVADSHPAAEAADNLSAAVAEDNRPGAAEGGIRHQAAAVGSRPADGVVDRS